MLEFTWPLVFLALPLPFLVYRILSRAPRQDAALYVPFFSVLSRLQSEHENITSSRLLNLICCHADLVIGSSSGQPAPVAGRASAATLNRA